MIITILQLWWMVFLGKVLCEYAAGTTTTTSAQLVHMELVLVNTLPNNQSGNIRSLTWSSRSLLSTTTEGSTTDAVPYRYQLAAAATSSTIQLWNSTTTTIPWTNDNNTDAAAAKNNSIQQQWEPVVDIFDAASVTNSSNGTIHPAPVRVISFSPNGKWLAVGDDDGMVHIWSLHTFPWSVVRTLSTSPTGKICSLSWQHGTLYLAAAGINFGVMVWDLTNNWGRVTFASRSSKLPPPPNDSYVHYVDWSPAEPGNTKNRFVLDSTIYEIDPIPPLNIFADPSDTNSSVIARAVTVLEACRLCTLSQWSPDGQFVGMAFGTTISISRQRALYTTNDTDANQPYEWDTIQTLTTVTDTYMVIGVMAWSPDGKYLAVGGVGNSNLFLYDSANWTAQPLTIPTSTGYSIDALSWQPDSQQIAIGTSRIIEIREIRYREPDAMPSMSPSHGSVVLTNSPSLQLDSDLGTASMVGIGIAAVVISFTCVGLVFYRRLLYVAKRNEMKQKNPKQRYSDVNEFFREGDKTSYADDDFDLLNQMDHSLGVPTQEFSVVVD